MSQHGSKPRKSLSKVLEITGPFLGLALVIGLFALSPDIRETFLSLRNFRIVLSQTVVVALCALGMTMIIIAGGIDLSVGSVVSLTGVVASIALQKGYSNFEAAAAAIACGGVLGLVNGTLIASLGITPFIITLGMLGIARGLAKLLADNQAVIYPGGSGIDQWMSPGAPVFLSFPMGVWIAVVLTIVVSLVLRKSVFGRYVHAIGSNELTARLCGVPTLWVKVLVYTLGGCLFGLAGLMQLSRLHLGDPTVAAGLELDVIAAVIIGGASLTGGMGGVLGSIIGALIMATLRNGSNQIGWPSYLQEIMIGLVIIVAVFIDQRRLKAQESQMK